MSWEPVDRLSLFLLFWNSSICTEKIYFKINFIEYTLKIWYLLCLLFSKEIFTTYIIFFLLFHAIPTYYILYIHSRVLGKIVLKHCSPLSAEISRLYVMSGGTQSHALPCYQSVEMKILRILFFRGGIEPTTLVMFAAARRWRPPMNFY